MTGKEKEPPPLPHTHTHNKMRGRRKEENRKKKLETRKVVVVCWLLKVTTTYTCISATDLLPHYNFLSHPVTVY